MSHHFPLVPLLREKKTGGGLMARVGFFFFLGESTACACICFACVGGRSRIDCPYVVGDGQGWSVETCMVFTAYVLGLNSGEGTDSLEDSDSQEERIGEVEEMWRLIRCERERDWEGFDLAAVGSASLHQQLLPSLS